MENAPLTLRDYKKISIHFLAGNFAPDTIYRMATGINELPMIVEKAIRAYREVQAQPASIIKTMETEAQKRLADEMLKANDLSKVEEIHLLHLSSANSDAEGFKRQVQSLTGIPTYIAGTKAMATI